MKHALQIPYTFVLMNWAAIVGLYHFLRWGKDIRQGVWTAHFPSSSQPHTASRKG